jgi:hypothetical protein
MPIACAALPNQGAMPSLDADPLALKMRDEIERGRIQAMNRAG